MCAQPYEGLGREKQFKRNNGITPQKLSTAPGPKRPPSSMAHKECLSTRPRSPLEADLMREVATDNPEAFALIFERYYRLVLVTALRILGDVGEAEDITQSVFLEIYRKATQFDPS